MSVSAVHPHPERSLDAAPSPVPLPLARDPRTSRLLEAPILPLLLRLSAPNVAIMLVQSALGLVETYFIGWLGIDALAGVALVFPLVMLMQMMSAGAMGGGISSAVARALGAGRRAEADALALHALVIALVLGLVFTVAVIAGGPALYGAMGGRGASLAAALTYSNVVFAGAVLIWVFNSLASVIRGTGNMLLPAGVTFIGAVLVVPLSPCLIFGWGPFPHLGIAGGAVALLIYYAAGTAALAAWLVSGRLVVRLVPGIAALAWPHFREILRVGAVAALVTMTTNLTVAIITALAGSFGPAAIAGYGVASRLEYLLVPLVFGLGGPLVALVGTNIGAGQPRRAMRAAWTGAAVAVAITETIGILGALFPHAWLSLFGADAGMLEAGTLYLVRVGPFYGMFGLGMALYFASQGAGRLRWPLIAGLARLAIAGGGGWLALGLRHQLGDVFLALAAALAAFGLINAAAVAGGAWWGAAPARRVGERQQ
jgi:putative MATE family efflux protein